MKRNNYSFSLKLLLLLFIGCTTIPTSTDKNPTLLVGKIVFIGSNYVSNNGISFDGTITSGIDIILVNSENNEHLRLSVDGNGLLCANIQEGKYIIDELYIKKTAFDGAWADLYMNPAQKVLEIERGKVNNIGTIRWSLVDRKHSMIQSDNSLAVKVDFSKKYPKSNWNQKEWKYSQLSTNVFKMSDEKISYFVKSDNGLDSTHITIPKNMPDNVRIQLENDIKQRLNDYRIRGDTTYYVKSESGLDSVLLKVPKAMPEESRRRQEEVIRNQLKLQESRPNNNDTITTKNQERIIRSSIIVIKDE